MLPEQGLADGSGQKQTQCGAGRQGFGVLEGGLGREIIGGLVVPGLASGFVPPSTQSQPPRISRLKRYPAAVRGELEGQAPARPCSPTARENKLLSGH